MSKATRARTRRASASFLGRRDPRFVVALLFVFVCLSCGVQPAKQPAPRADLPRMFREAFRLDALGDPREAMAANLTVVQAAARVSDDPWAMAALQSALDAIATRALPSLDSAAGDAALVGRVRDDGSAARELVRASAEAAGPLARGLIAHALTAMAERRGDAGEAERWRAAGGCVREALVIGPVTWAVVTGVDDTGPLDHADARIEPRYAVNDAFDRAVSPVAARGRGCAIDLSAESGRPGVREVVVDVDVPRAQWIGVAMRAHGAARLRAGGLYVLGRPFELGDGEVVRLARVQATGGTLRLAVRVGTGKEEDAVEIDVWGEDGGPLRTRAPPLGSTADGRATVAAQVTTPDPQSDDETLLSATAALAAGDCREAERVLWPVAALGRAPPDLTLVYARAIEAARDLSPATRAERGRSASERVLEGWPDSWEAIVAHAVLAGQRRGRDEAGVEALRDLEATRAKGREPESAVLDAFDAMTSGRERLFDRAGAALERARARLAGTGLFADAEDAVSPRSGAELVAALCDSVRPGSRDTLKCFDALHAAGDRKRSAQELARLRQVFGAPARFLPIELREALDAGDDAAASRVFGAMLPGERTLAAQAAVDSSPDAAAHLLALSVGARDAPAAIAPLLRFDGDDPTREFEGVADRIAAEDRASAIMPGTATAVLAHRERYDVGATGLVRWLLFDVRRVSGTTDVEENAQASTPQVWGRGVMRALRRRILKRDGRVLEPDRTPHASQGHADLAQLEQGDLVEAIYEGWLLPGDNGDIGVDTPDLLPERTAVHDAEIELRLPRDLRASHWSHPALGRPVERSDGNARVLSWRVVDQPERRIEDGVPKMDRSVGVSFSTAQWSGIASVLRETIAALGEHEPEVAAWAREASGRETTADRPAVDAIVVAAGKALREADPSVLSDYEGGLVAAQSRTARTFLTSHDGSRSWLVARALGARGIAFEIVVAENQPYSGDPSFPPHFGRFVHPLVVARVDGKEVWIDADVPGPPLPAGRVSPELRGRSVLHADGSVSPLPALGGDEERDEVDVRLVLDARGNARGTLALILGGRQAEELSEAFLRVVGAERQRALRGVVLSWLPWANVEEVQLASGEASGRLTLRAEVSVSGYAQRESGKTWLMPGLDTLHWAWPNARVSSLGATFATRAGRESSLALDTAVQYHVHRRVDLPKGASVVRMAGPVHVRTNLIEASHSIGVADAGQVVEEDFVLGVATGTIAAKDYDAFVAVTRTVDDGFLTGTRIAMP
jgi:hypothetical protein